MNRAIKQADGVFYTPARLADYLLSECSDFGSGAVLDPACGGLALIRAAQNRFGGRKNISYYGCDKREVGDASRGIDVACIDFFAYSPAVSFELIVTNPPYVRGCKCPSSSREWYARNKKKGFEVSARSDLWVYFILKSISMLAPGGCLAAILPWSFFQAEYSIPIRRYLAETFGRIKCLIVTQEQFKDTTQKVVLVWLEGRGRRLESIQCGVVNKLPKGGAHYQTITEEDWVSMVWMRNKADGVFRRGQFYPLSDFCDVKIGIVPGATEFFVRSRDELVELGVKLDRCPEILTSGRQLCALDVSDIGVSPRHLLCLTPMDATKEKCRNLIAEGVAKKLNERRHCQNRAHWFSLKPPKRVPDAFFSYRSSTIPIMMMNDRGVVNTNAVHSVYFTRNDLTVHQKRWIQLSLLSAFSLIDVELKARTYGKNVLKIEPTALKSVKVYCSDCPMAKKGIVNISAKLRNHDMKGVVEVATSIVGRAMGLGERQIVGVLKRYAAVRQRRTGVNFLTGTR